MTPMNLHTQFQSVDCGYFRVSSKLCNTCASLTGSSSGQLQRNSESCNDNEHGMRATAERVRTIVS